MWENADDRMVRKRIDYGDVSIAYFSVCREKAMGMMMVGAVVGVVRMKTAL